MKNKSEFINNVNELSNIFDEYLSSLNYEHFTKRMICIDYVEKFGIDDIKGFIQWCKCNNNIDDIKSTLAHDFGGVKDEGMLPRTSGYSKYINLQN